MSTKDQDPAPTDRWRRRLREFGSTALILAVALTARASLADHYYVPSGSMIPTVEIGDRVLVNKLAYGLRVPLSQYYLVEFDGPQRGEVVILSSPVDGRNLLKRVIGLPGDSIEVKAGRVYLNRAPVPLEGHGGELLEVLGAVKHPIRIERGGGPDYGPLVIPKRKYLVLGDNRGDSLDGRFFGLVDREAFLGRASRLYYHKDEFAWLAL